MRAWTSSTVQPGAISRVQPLLTDMSAGRRSAEEQDSKASAIKQRGGWVISASGGVEMLPWHIASEVETVEAVGDVRNEMSADVEEIWWE